MTSLCQFVRRLFTCLFLQHESKRRHVSFWHDGHRLHKGDMSCLRKCFLQDSYQDIYHSGPM